MAQGDASVYNHFKEQLLLGAVDCVGDTFKMTLLGSGYALNVDGNNGYANISAQEITAAGYSAGGLTLTGESVTQNDGGDYAMWDAANLTWTSLGATTVDHAVMYDDTITAPVADPLAIHFEITTQPNGANYSLNFNAGGIAQLA